MKNGSLGMSAPCNKCFKLLKRHNIKNIVYSTEHGFSKILDFDVSHGRIYKKVKHNEG